jgi:hypothetical protein
MSSEKPVSENLLGSSPSEVGKRLFVRTISTSTDENLSPVKSTVAEQDSASEDEKDDNESRRRQKRRASVGGSLLASQMTPRNFVDSRFIVSPKYMLPTFDLLCAKVDRDIYFIHIDGMGVSTVFFRVSRLPKSLLGQQSWQIYCGKNEPIAVLKQAGMSLTSAFYLFTGTDAEKGSVVYTFVKKLRSTKIRIFQGEGYKESALLRYFCFIASDRVFIKLTDIKSLGEVAGETIADWRMQTSSLRMGKGFDSTLAVACFCLADYFDPLTIEASTQARTAVASSASAKHDYRSLFGW